MEGEYVVVLGIIHTCIALRYKPAFTATQYSVGLARKRPWLNPRSGRKDYLHLFLLLHMKKSFITLGPGHNLRLIGFKPRTSYLSLMPFH